MCWPSCKGGAYLAVSIFVYRAILVIITMISSSITRLKSTYLPISVIEELLLQLVYFIPIFTSSSFIFIGLESNSFTYVFYATIALSTTIFFRYCAELTFIYMVNWEAYRLKTPSLYLNLTVDLILLLILLLYARNWLRNSPWKTSKQIHKEESGEESALLLSRNANSSSAPPKVKDTNIRNDLLQQNKNANQTENSITNRNLNPQGQGQSELKSPGIGQGVGEGVALHYPPIVHVDRNRLMRPLPPVPKDELDDISLPPPIPLASPDYDDI